ncbi:MAG TPA: alpha/beta fold hydrolase [Burkholderiales bacterium]
MTREVVLVPGLWMPAGAMSLLAARLGRYGFEPRLFPLRGREAMAENVERLSRFARERLAGRPAHFVGHSLGGVLILEALERHRDIAVASVVLLGAPVRGSRVGRRFSRLGLGRWMMGAAGAHWAERAPRWGRPEPLGVVAGTLSLGLGRLLGNIEGVNDGVVGLEETPIEGMTAQAQVAVSHSMLIASGRVARMVRRFLAEGRLE